MIGENPPGSYDFGGDNFAFNSDTVPMDQPVSGITGQTSVAVNTEVPAQEGVTEAAESAAERPLFTQSSVEDTVPPVEQFGDTPPSDSKGDISDSGDVSDSSSGAPQAEIPTAGDPTLQTLGESGLNYALNYTDARIQEMIDPFGDIQRAESETGIVKKEDVDQAAGFVEDVADRRISQRIDQMTDDQQNQTFGLVYLKGLTQSVGSALSLSLTKTKDNIAHWAGQVSDLFWHKIDSNLDQLSTGRTDDNGNPPPTPSAGDSN